MGYAKFWLLLYEHESKCTYEWWAPCSGIRMKRWWFKVMAKRRLQSPDWESKWTKHTKEERESKRWREMWSDEMHFQCPNEKWTSFDCESHRILQARASATHLNESGFSLGLDGQEPLERRKRGRILMLDTCGIGSRDARSSGRTRSRGGESVDTIDESRARLLQSTGCQNEPWSHSLTERERRVFGWRDRPFLHQSLGVHHNHCSGRARYYIITIGLY